MKTYIFSKGRQDNKWCSLKKLTFQIGQKKEKRKKRRNRRSIKKQILNKLPSNKQISYKHVEKLVVDADAKVNRIVNCAGELLCSCTASHILYYI